ncbi:MAG: 16S rRNA (uracil(1498)-N(3))-methyltransferase [Muribaculaceae bacterium]|nr:16S rRNA (uracil(1498)-N(3))-methyltransferase [Muribaculaceae bacterium]
MIQFYGPDILTNPVLPESDSQHCIRVLRMGYGDMIEVVDGKGYRHRCRIADPHAKHTLLEVVESVEIAQPWSGNITVAVAPTKHLDRMEWLIEKLVEIGINRFVPLLCRHSERKEIKIERISKIAISAMKQSLKATMPIIDEMTPLRRFVDECRDSQRFVAYCADDVERRLLARELRPEGDVTILIGPEGDFSPEEVAFTLGNGFIPVSLGDCRLRTETAALAACQTVHVIKQLNY